MARVDFHKDARGAVYVEFLIAFFPLFLMFLSICQLALLAAADAIVRHAAYSAVRSAVVVLEDKPSKFGDAPRGSLYMGDPRQVEGFEDIVAKLGYGQKKSHSRSQKSKNSAAEVAAAIADTTRSILAGETDLQPGARMEPIRAAGYLPLVPLAPSARLAQPNSETVASGLASLAGAQLGFATEYTKAAATVTLHDDLEGQHFATDSIGPKGMVTAKVTYVYHCSIPLVRALMCRSLSRTVGGKRHLMRVAKELPSLVNPEARFKLLTATASLPNQGADYEPRDKD